jgi:hypothetical protein
MNKKNPLTTIAGKVHECVPVAYLTGQARKGEGE